MKISTTWSSSRMATRVSCAPEEMIISLFITYTPAAEDGYRCRARRGDRTCEHAEQHPIRLIREAPHPDIQDEAETRERCDERRSAVAHERQRDALHRR